MKKNRMTVIMTVLVLVFMILSGFSFSVDDDMPPGQPYCEDYYLYVNILLENHPDLINLVSGNGLDVLMKVLSNQMVSCESYKTFNFQINQLAYSLRDGHTFILEDFDVVSRLEHSGKIFPLPLKIIDGSAYVDYMNEDIPLGSEVLAIDGENMSELIGKYSQYTSIDGYSEGLGLLNLEEEFSILYAIDRGYESEYQVVYKAYDGNVASEVISTSGINYFEAFTNRHSDYLLTRGNYIDFKVIDDSTAMIRLPDFNLTEGALNDYYALLDDIFWQLSLRDTEHLIIDLRENPGGREEVLVRIYSYFTDEPFEIYDEKYYYRHDFTRTEHLSKLFTLFEGDVRTTVEKYEGYILEGKAEEISGDVFRIDVENFEPSGDHYFDGQVYVLVGPETFSSATILANKFYENPKAVLIGEETGGSYYTMYGGYFGVWTLPNTGHHVFIPQMKIVLNAEENPAIPEGRGIIPDYPSTLAPEDYINQVDTQLMFTLDLIRSLQ